MKGVFGKIRESCFRVIVKWGGKRWSKEEGSGGEEKERIRREEIRRGEMKIGIWRKFVSKREREVRERIEGEGDWMVVLFGLVEGERRWEGIKGSGILKVNGCLEERGWIEGCWNGGDIKMCEGVVM